MLRIVVMRKLILAATMMVVPTLARAQADYAATGRYQCPAPDNPGPGFEEAMIWLVIFGAVEVFLFMCFLWRKHKANQRVRYWQRYNAMEERHEWETAEWEALGRPKHLGEFLAARQAVEKAPYARNLAKYWASVGVTE